MRGRSADYSKEETLHFLNIAASIKPADLPGWQRVLQEHNLTYAHMNRTADSLRRKFNQLNGKKIPTGDPKCPEQVRLAKRVKLSINEGVDMDPNDDPNERLQDNHTGEIINMSDGVGTSTFEGETEDERETDEDPNGSVGSGGSGSVAEANGSGDNSNGNNGSAASNGNNVSAASNGNNGNRATNTVQNAAGSNNRPRINNSTAPTSNASTTDSLNKPTGKTRLLVTPRSKNSKKEEDNTIKDLIRVQLLQMQEDRDYRRQAFEEERARREDDRARREQKDDQFNRTMMIAFGLYAKANNITMGDGSSVSNNTGNSNTGSNTTTANNQSP
jgi:hypothetical protein